MRECFPIIFFLLLSTGSLSQTSFQQSIEAEYFTLRHMDIVCNKETCYVISTGQREAFGDFFKGLLISKLDTFGVIEWCKEYYFECYLPTTYQSLITKEGNIIVTFHANEHYPSCDITLNDPVYDSYLINISPNGSLVWDTRTATAGITVPIKVVEMLNEDFVLINENDVLRMDKTGKAIWKKSLSLGERARLLRVLPLMDGGLFLLGQKTRGTEFPDDLYNGVLMKMNAAGELLWSKVIQDFSPWELDLFPNGDVLLTGHRLRTNKEARYMRFSPEGQLHWVKHLPQQNELIREHIIILPDGSIVDFINTGTDTKLLKLNSKGEVLWAKTYLANDNTTEWFSEKGNLLAYGSDGGFYILNERLERYGQDVIIKTDSLGKLSSCYSTNWCIETLESEIPAMQSANVTGIEILEEEETEFTSLNHVLIDISVTAKDYCPKLPVPSPYFTLADTFCINTPIQIDSLCQSEAELWRWQAQGRTLSNEANPQDLQFETAGQYTLSHIIETNGCLDTFSRVVEIVDAPVFDIGQDTVLCEDTPFAWNIEQGKLQNYIWSDSITGAQRSINASDIYTAFAEDDYCQVRASRRIDFIEDLFPESPINLGADTSICQQIPYVLDVTHPQASSYLWSDGNTNSVRTIREAGTYSLTATVATCPFEDEIVVQTEDCAGKLYIPTAFSPNGDGVNDFFEIATKNAALQEVQIFNRWGNLVYEGTQAWDGRIDGKPAEAGLYVCKVVYEETLLGLTKKAIGELILID